MQTNEYGGKGFRLLENGFSPVSGEYLYCIVVIEDAVITATNLKGGDALTAESIPAGTYIYGVFSPEDITIASGRAIGYIQ